MLHFLLEIIIMTRSTKTRLLLRDKCKVVHSDRLYRPSSNSKCGAVWCGAVRCGAVQCGVMRCVVLWCCVVWCGAVWCGAVRCGVVWYGMLWCGMVHIIPILCCAVLCRAVLCCAVLCCAVAWCGVVWCGVVWCGVVCCGVVWCAVLCCSVVWCGVVWLWCGVVWCGVVCIMGLVEKLKTRDILEHQLQQRPNTKWRLSHITNVLYITYNLRHIIGSMVVLPDSLLSKRSINCLLYNNKHSNPYNDNLCMFRCLMFHKHKNMTMNMK